MALPQRNGKQVRLAVCIPNAMPFFNARSVMSLLNLRHPHGVATTFIRGGGPCPEARRADCVRQAETWCANYVLFLDADQTYQSDLIEKMVPHMGNRLECVAGLVPIGRHPHKANCFVFRDVFHEDGGVPTGLYDHLSFEGDELVEADLVGSGCLLVRMDVFSSLSKPWFKTVYEDEFDWKLKATEDMYFSWKLKKELGLTLWVDPTIRIGHMVEKEVTGKDTNAEGAADRSLRGSPGSVRETGTQGLPQRLSSDENEPWVAGVGGCLHDGVCSIA